ncbi:MAG: hypothetical protein AAGC55_16505, partial [Myxococcota bacterium]
ANCCLSPGQKCPPRKVDWAAPTWESLKVSMDDPHYLRYELRASGIVTSAEFTVLAFADHDSDGELSTYSTFGRGSTSGGSSGGVISRVKDLE